MPVTPLYDVSTSAMLSKEAAALAISNPALFQAHELLAETLLNLELPVYTQSRAIDQISTALAMQVNFQIKQGIDSFILSSSTSQHTKQTDVYRSRMIDPRAQALASVVAGMYGMVNISRYTSTTSVRRAST